MRLGIDVGTERCREVFESVFEETDPALVCLDVLACCCKDLLSASKIALRVTGGLEGSERPVTLLLTRGGGGGIDPSLGALPERLDVRDRDDEFRVTGSLLGDCAPRDSVPSFTSVLRWVATDSLVSIFEDVSWRLALVVRIERFLEGGGSIEDIGKMFLGYFSLFTDSD